MQNSRRCVVWDAPQTEDAFVGLYYRKLTVWRKAMDVAAEIYRLAPRLPSEEAYGLRSQITRAAASVPANIAEGWVRESPRERAQFLAIAHGSLAEVETLVELCEQAGYFPTRDTACVRGLMEEVGKMLGALRRRSRRR